MSDGMLKKYYQFELGQVCSRLSSGKGIAAKEISEHGVYPVFGGNGLRGYSDRKNFEGQCAIIGRQGAFCGNVRFFSGEAYMTEHAVVVCANEKSDIKYLSYLLGTLNLGRLSGQSAQPGLSVKTLSKQVIQLPDISEQHQIAKVLSAFDDKIELNTQINHNLEEQAKAIFKSWFVDFEPFAGKEPDGSKMVDLQSICELVTKGTTPTTLGFAFTQDGINFIKAESISDTHSFDIDKFSYIDQQTNNALKRSIIQDGDILFTIAGTLGRFAIADKSILPANTNQAVAIIRPKLTEAHPYYIYSFLLGGWHTEHYRKKVQQAVQANLSLTTIKSLPILLLPETLKQQYENIITPLFKKILQNTLENRTICKLRDALLPKLMSGEIDVSEVEV